MNNKIKNIKIHSFEKTTINEYRDSFHIVFDFTYDDIITICGVNFIIEIFEVEDNCAAKEMCITFPQSNNKEIIKSLKLEDMLQKELIAHIGATPCLCHMIPILSF